MKQVLALIAASVVAGCSVFGIRSGTEEPGYEVADRIGQVEVRRYGQRLAADTLVEGDEEAARKLGFRRLADYIFGNNTARHEIAMTAPLAQSSTTIAMTAPVAQQNVEPGRWRIRFIMPNSYTLATLPRPNDDAIEIVTVPSELVAVLRFSGSRSAAAIAERQRALLSAVASSSWRVTGPAAAWFYDPPWTLPWFRRNEVMFPVGALAN